MALSLRPSPYSYYSHFLEPTEQDKAGVTNNLHMAYCLTVDPFNFGINRLPIAPWILNLRHSKMEEAD